MKLALIFAFCFILKVACEGNTVLPSSCASDLATTVSKSLELLKNALGRECPDRWLYFQDSCYLYGKETMKFAAAQKVCEDSDSHLVYINDEEENTFLKDMAREMTPRHWWVGLTHDVVAGTWVWNDGSRPTFTDWYKGRPVSAGECALLHHGSYNFTWYDTVCGNNYNFICEK